MIVELEPRRDERGFFARAFCADEFSAHGLVSRVVQTNLSYNRQAGTLRGLHYQRSPHAETKLIRCIAGAAFMVVADLRPHSETYLEHSSVTLRRGDLRSLYVPEGCAAGMQTLEDDTELLYQVSEFYTPEAEGGVRFDDPALGIDWPRAPTVMSEKDAGWPYLDAEPTTP